MMGGQKTSWAGRSARTNHQGYQLLDGSVNFAVDDGHVELRLGGELLAGGRQPALAFLLVLGAAADQPADQLVPRRGLEEHEDSVGRGLPDLARALEVDLEQRGRPAANASSTGPRGVP